MARIFDDTPCTLGEGPLWHPRQQALFWFDIVESRLYRRDSKGRSQWQFDENVSAAGWIDDHRLLIASESALVAFDTTDGSRTPVAALEADNPVTRSNDGRADPAGGFWIGTMGKKSERGAGAIYRYYRGALRRLWNEITIPNAIAFAPDGRSATFADTIARQVMRVALDAEGWPAGAPEVFLDLREDELNPDGAVFDAQGRLWLALWGTGQVACHAPTGERLGAITVDAPHASCPAFAGAGSGRLFCTTARQWMQPQALEAQPASGAVFEVEAPLAATGLAEHRVIV